MLAKIAESSGGGEALAPAALAASNAFKVGAFSRAVQDLVSKYVQLEEYYMVRNVSKAIRINEVVAEAPTSSMVDDVFYILMTCARRTTSTGSVQCACAGLNHVNNLLANEFREALAAGLKGAAAKLLSAAPDDATMGGAGGGAGGGGGGDASASFAAPGVAAAVATAFNNADVSAEYVLKLKRDLEDLAEAFPGSAERERVRGCLHDMQETSALFRQMVGKALEELAAAALQRVRGALEALGACTYTLTEATYSENEVEDVWVQRVLATATALLEWAKPLLTARNHEALVHTFTDALVARVEATALQKKFNQLGGLQLDRELRTLTSGMAALTQRSVRDKFARLTQIATILNLESVAEMLDYWGDQAGPMNWRLTPAEVRKVLALRTEFHAEAIAALRL